jgi:sulfite reductase (ferredoxin)
LFVGFELCIWKWRQELSDSISLAPPPPAVKETKAQKVERLKREKNPWEAWDEVRRFAREGRESVLPEWAGTYFKWWGVYTQGDGLGVTGGVGGEGKASEYFMMRIGLPNGLLTAHQLHVIADITAKYARGVADITTRQNIQLHWLTIESQGRVRRCGAECDGVSAGRAGWA